MRDRPAMFGAEHAAAFEDPDVVREYELRAPYPPAAFDVLLELIDSARPVVLDLGCGPGPIARGLAAHVERIDAVDPSDAMLAEARRRAANVTNIRWIHARAEDAPLDPPYGLATAGASVHWMDWDVVLPRIAGALTPSASFAILTIEDRSAPWHEDLKRLFDEYSVYGKSYQEFDVVSELERRALYVVRGRRRVSMQFAQPLDEYVRALHSHSSLARARIGHERARAFDDHVRAIVRRGHDKLVHRDVECEIVWGRPLLRDRSSARRS